MDFSIGSILYPLAIALLGSLHCMGMCGGFSLLVANSSASRFRYPLYQTGKTLAYTLLATGIYFLTMMITHAGTMTTARYGVTLLAGLAMGWLALTGLLKGRYPGVGLSLPTRLLQKAVSRPLFFGFLNGLMPCGLVYMLLVAIPLADTLPEAMTLALLFGLGTVPSLGLVYLGSSLLQTSHWRWIEKVLYVFLLSFALVTILRAIPATEKMVHGWFPHSVRELFMF